MTKIFLFLTGFGFSVIGLTYTIAYLNLLAVGYNFKEYAKIICKRPECLISIIGLIMITLVIYLPRGEDNNETNI